MLSNFTSRLENSRKVCFVSYCPSDRVSECFPIFSFRFPRFSVLILFSVCQDPKRDHHSAESAIVVSRETVKRPAVRRPKVTKTLKNWFSSLGVSPVIGYHPWLGRYTEFIVKEAGVGSVLTFAGWFVVVRS